MSDEPESTPLLAGSNKELQVWEITPSDDWIFKRTIRDHLRPITCQILLGTGHFVTGSTDSLIQVYDASGKRIKTLRAHHGPINDLAVVSPDLFVSCSNDRTVKVWDSNTFEVVNTLEGHHKWVSSVAGLSESRSKVVVSASWDRTIKIWEGIDDPETSRCTVTLVGHGLAVRCLLYHPTEVDEKIISGSNDCHVRVWDLQTGRCIHTLEAHEADVVALCRVGPRQVASASKDRSIMIWDVFEGLRLRWLRGHRGRVNCLIRLGNDILLSGSEDCTMRKWSTRSGKCLMRIERSERKPIMSLLLLESDIVRREREELEERCEYLQENLLDFTLAFPGMERSSSRKLLVTGGGGGRGGGGEEGEEGEGEGEEEDAGGEEADVHIEADTRLLLFKTLFALADVKVHGDRHELDSDSVHESVLQMDPSFLLNLLLGVEVPIEESDYFPLYVFFRAMRMKKHMYLACKMAEKAIQSPAKLCSLMELSLSFLEGDPVIIEGQALRFKSAFSISILNALKAQYVEIFKNQNLAKRLDQMRLLQQLLTYEPRSITKHRDIGLRLPPEAVSFKALFEENVSYLYRTKEYANYVLRTKTGGTFPVHREILILRSNFFYNLFRENEFSVDNELLIDSLSDEELVYVLEFTYLRNIQSREISMLLVLLQHAQMHRDTSLRSFLVTLVKNLCSELHHQRVFETSLHEWGYLFDEIDDQIQATFINYWSLTYDLHTEVIHNLIEQSVSHHDQEIDIRKALHEKDLALKSSMAETKLMDRISDANSSFQEELEGKDGIIAEKDRLLEDREKALEGKDGIIAEKDRLLEDREKELEMALAEIQSLRTQLRERNLEISKFQSALEEKADEVDSGAEQGSDDEVVSGAEQRSDDEAEFVSGAEQGSDDEVEFVSGAEQGSDDEVEFVSGAEQGSDDEVVSGAEQGSDDEVVSGAEQGSDDEVVSGAEQGSDDAVVSGAEQRSDDEVEFVSGAEQGSDDEVEFVSGAEQGSDDEVVSGAEQGSDDEGSDDEVVSGAEHGSDDDGGRDDDGEQGSDDTEETGE